LINNPFRGCGGALNAVLLPRFQTVRMPKLQLFHALLDANPFALLVGMLLDQQ